MQVSLRVSGEPKDGRAWSAALEENLHDMLCAALTKKEKEYESSNRGVTGDLFGGNGKS